MKKNKVWKIVWIVGIYAILITILYLVILYKVEWEDKDLNTYLYFYDCNDNLCTATTKQDKYYSRYMCENNFCPYITSVINNNLILTNDKKSLIYDYVNGKVVNDSYDKYRFIDDDIVVVTDLTSKKEGIINLDGEILVDVKYDYVDDFKNELISFRNNDLFGVSTIDGTNIVDSNFEDIVLINNEIYAGVVDNTYRIYSYVGNEPVNTNQYEFVDSFDNLIFVVSNNRVDILTDKLNSTLLIRIDTFYSYTTEKERESLNLRSDGDYIYFNIYNDKYEITKYKYDIKNKKLV